MTDETLSVVDRPFFAGYYKDRTAFDDVVSIDAMKHLVDVSGTPAGRKRLVTFPNVGTYTLSSELWSNDLDSVMRETFKFADDVLKLPGVP